jgi:hypothetical protein
MTCRQRKPITLPHLRDPAAGTNVDMGGAALLAQHRYDRFRRRIAKQLAVLLFVESDAVFSDQIDEL